jgi:hypothetical protein
MRILILSQSRSGSTGLTAWLKSETNEPVMVNPFNPFAKSEEQLNEDLEWLKSDRGLILKFVDNMFLKSSNPDVYDPNRLISRFDKVIGLTREDDYACAYSRLIGELSNNWRGNSQSSEVSQYEIYQNMYKVDLYIPEVQKHKEFILELPLFQITYEEIYKEKNVSRLLDYLEIQPKNLEYLFENKNITNNWNF